jgi:cellobiose phosphorylase
LNSLSDSVMRKAAKRFYDTEKVFTVDRNPPEAAVLLSGGEFSGVLCDADAFFGKGGVYSPDYFRKNETTNENGNPRQAKNAMLAPFIDFSLNAGEEKVLTFVYLYFPADKDKNALVEKYKNCDAKKLFLESCQSWHAEGVNAEIEGEEWISRELKWHNAYLRGGMSYADFYGAHILSQGGHYQYLMGLQGAPRDQLQHSLPYIYSDPQIAREHIMFTLREMSPEGELPYATTGQGVLISFVMVPSDLQFMLLSFAGEFALATRDTDFFNSTYVCKFKGKETTRTVWEGIKLAYKYATQNVGKGEHGLIRMKTGDWNDQAVYGRVPLTQTRTAQKFGESMLNSAMAVYSFKVFSEAAKLMGDQALFAEAKKWSDDLREAVAAQWNGNWFKRAWMGKKVGWLGDDLLWLEPQPWALIGGAAEGEKAEILVKNIDKQLCTINPNGAALLSSGGEQSAGLDTGVLENGGIWYAINGYLVWALAKAGYGDLAFLEWKKNTRAYQAEAYPDIWYGIWSAPDSVNSSFAKYPGRTQNSKNPVTGKREKLFKLTVGVDWEDYPVLNLHAHTWQQYALFKLLGLEFESGKMTIKPAIPKQRYSVTSKLFSLSFDGKTYRVKYNPLNSVNITVVFDTGANPAKSLTLNGKQTAFETMGSAIGFPVSGSGVEFEIEV